VALGGMRSRFLAWEQVYNNGNSGASKVIDWEKGNVQTLTLTDECTLEFSNPLNGLHVLIVSVGEDTYTLTYPENVLWAEGDDLGIDANTLFLFEFYYDGTQYLGRACHYTI
jgi:hypothetical protein